MRVEAHPTSLGSRWRAGSRSRPVNAAPGDLHALLGVLPGLGERMVAAERLGFRWEAHSAAFAGGRTIGHVGVLSLSMYLDHRAATVGGIHATCTHPEHRGRGHAAQLLDDALGWCDERFDTVRLTTAIPRFYERFGFRPVTEHRFV